MNLSQRLDQARARRNPAAEPTAYELRMTRDAQVYDGRHLRTGEAMTPEQWEQRQAAEQEAGLPAWNPNRANEHVEYAGPELVIDLTDPGADAIDLRTRSRSGPPDAPVDDVFDMPGWARQEQVFRGETERP